MPPPRPPCHSWLSPDRVWARAGVAGGGGAGSTGTASGTAMSLEAIRYRRGSLSILNQLLLPEQLRYEPVDSVERAWEAIRAMEVSGGGGSRDPQPPPPIRGWPPS